MDPPSVSVYISAMNLPQIQCKKGKYAKAAAKLVGSSVLSEGFIWKSKHEADREVKEKIFQNSTKTAICAVKILAKLAF